MSHAVAKEAMLQEIEADFGKLDSTNQAIFYVLIKGLVNRNSSDIKLALDWSIEHNGSSPDLLAAYATFGVVPYVVEVQP